MPKLAKYMMIAAFLLPAPAFATPFDGLYFPAGYSWSCNPDHVGMDGGAMAVSGDRFFGVESECRLTRPTQVRGMGAVLYDASCSSEGIESSSRLMLMRHSAGIFLVTDGMVSDLRTCR